MKKHLAIVQYIAVWLLLVIVSKGTGQLLWVTEIAFFTIYALKKRKRIARCCGATADGHRFLVGLEYFLFVAFVFLLLSYINLPKLWNIQDLRFNSKFIYRHFMIIPELTMALGIGWYLYEKKVVTTVQNKTLVLLTIIGVILKLFFGGRILISGLTVLCLSLLIIRKRIYWLLIAVPFVFVLEQTAYIIASLALVIIIILQKKIMKLFRIESKTKIICIILCFAIVVVASSSVLMVAIESDENSIWRLYVWKTEFTSLMQTWFTGVGFGSAYVSNEMFILSDNIGMYNDEKVGVDNGVFVVASHNTFMNVFYRMGIIGAYLFVMMHINLLVWAVKNYWKSADNERKYIIWGVANFACFTVVILLNPGLESLQFAIGYVFAMASLVAVLLQTQTNIMRA